jgi:hypothetical protein
MVAYPWLPPVNTPAPHCSPPSSSQQAGTVSQGNMAPGRMKTGTVNHQVQRQTTNSLVSPGLCPVYLNAVGAMQRVVVDRLHLSKDTL